MAIFEGGEMKIIIKQCGYEKHQDKYGGWFIGSIILWGFGGLVVAFLINNAGIYLLGWFIWIMLLAIDAAISPIFCKDKKHNKNGGGGDVPGLFGEGLGGDI